MYLSSVPPAVGARSFTSYSNSATRDHRPYESVVPTTSSAALKYSSSSYLADKYASFAPTTSSAGAMNTFSSSYRPSTLLSNSITNNKPSASSVTNLLNFSSTTSAAIDNLNSGHLRDLPTTSATTNVATAATGSLGHLPTAGLASSLGLNPLNTESAATAGSRPHTGQHLLQQLFDDMRQIEDTVDSIEIPARGRCKVYMAKYGYDPFKQSPNDNPDAELAFNAGDYIMVFDDIDEDGYFIGELMDGRRGYVPSNWLDRLTGEDLFEFQASTLYKQTNKGGTGANDDDCESNSYPPEFYDAIVSETMNHSNFQHILAPEDYHRMNDYVDLDDVNEVDDECLSDYERAEAEQMRRAVPPPQRLVLERQLNKSILIGWLHPQAAKGTIVSYQVYVDGVLKSTVPSGDRTKALLEGVDSNIPHRISVRAIDLNGRHSNDAGCTIVIGQKIPFAPSCVKASHITSDSALISWLPCNSNFHHVVAVNSVEVQTVRPGVYKHLINGLSSNTLYRVWVRAKPGKILSIDEKNPKKLESLTTYVDFKTMPKSLPDPPVNVQVEAGPQRRTLLVTWLPLTLNDFGSSNGCAVTGYAVFAGHKKLADIDSPTGDHALLDLADLESLHKKSVTVRTKSGENLSQDSMPCHIPDEYLKAAGPKEQAAMMSSNQHHRVASHHHQQNHHSSPLRHNASSSGLQRHNHQAQSRPGSRYSQLRGRQMARSLQNLESDLDSHRSSIPAIEVTRETSGSEHQLGGNPLESYSEEEFENSMRFRGLGRLGKQPGQRGQQTNRYRARQSHSVDSSVPRRFGGGTTPLMMDARAGDIIRYFVALFDYDPSTMSPNPNAASEELAFKEGSIIKVFGDKGPDGFYRGELDNHIGYVPCNVVSEITDPALLYNLQQQDANKSANRQHQLTLVGGQANNLQPHQSYQQAGAAVKRMTALYDYDPQENSPNADTESEIPFKMGDVIYVYGKMDTDGFYMGEVERTKQRGLVPSNFLREDPLPTNVMQSQQQPNIYNPNMNPSSQFQQVRVPNPSQFMNQQQPVGGNMDGSMAYNQQQRMQGNPQQQQQQMNKMNPNAQMRGQVPNVRGVLPQQQMQNPQQRSTMDANRPNSLSLGVNSGTNQVMQPSVNDWNSAANPRQPFMGPNQQMQGPQGMANQPMLQQQQQYGNQMGLMQGNQQQLNNMQQLQNQQLNTNQQQQQQQQVGGGVLSNLLSSGKQIIGAATTPRAPNQPNQLPSMNQIGNVTSATAGGLNQQLQQQQHQQMPNNSMDFNPAYSTASNRMNNIMPQQQQAAFNPNDHSASMTQPIHNSQYGLAGNQSQQQQAQHYNHMGMNRGGPMNPQMGEEQGGNILSTVKNMFKL